MFSTKPFRSFLKKLLPSVHLHVSFEPTHENHKSVYFSAGLKAQINEEGCVRKGIRRKILGKLNKVIIKNEISKLNRLWASLCQRKDLWFQIRHPDGLLWIDGNLVWCKSSFWGAPLWGSRALALIFYKKLLCQTLINGWKSCWHLNEGLWRTLKLCWLLLNYLLTLPI